MKKNNRFVYGLILLIVSTALAQDESPSKQSRRGVVLLIGDGMGVNQLAVAEIYSREVLNKKLAIRAMPRVGVTTTHSFDSEITDSSSAATALFGGQKINNGVLNILPDGNQVESLLLAMKQTGKSLGIVTTTRVTHATPAGMYAITPHRDNENEIAVQLMQNGPDVVLGGGWRHFIPSEQKSSKRKDNRDVLSELTAAGYTKVGNRKELMTFNPQKSTKLLGLFSKSHMAYELDRTNVVALSEQPSLAEMTQVALNTLAHNSHGFFLLVEGGRIDHACHSHDVKALIYDVIAFDDAVRVALEYQASHTDVAVIVTADHETGGLGLGRESEYELSIDDLSEIPNSIEHACESIIEDPSSAMTVTKNMFKDVPPKVRQMLTLHPPDSSPSDIEMLDQLYEVEEYISCWAHYVMSMTEDELAGIGWTSYAHTAQPVLTYSIGFDADMLSGFHDNRDVSRCLRHCLGL